MCDLCDKNIVKDCEYYYFLNKLKKDCYCKCDFGCDQCHFKKKKKYVKHHYDDYHHGYNDWSWKKDKHHEKDPYKDCDCGCNDWHFKKKKEKKVCCCIIICKCDCGYC